MHTREDGGIDARKAADLTKNWTFQSLLTPGNGSGKENIEMGGLKIWSSKPNSIGSS